MSCLPRLGLETVYLKGNTAASDDHKNEGGDQRQDDHSIAVFELFAVGPVVLLGGNQWRDGLRDGLGRFILHRRTWILDTGLLDARY